MNNKGFTLIEVLSVVILISIIAVITFTTVGTTFSASKEEAYKIMKNNLVKSGYSYINECNLGTINCEFSFKENNKFTAYDLYNAGYLKNLESPIDGRNIGTCLILEATKDNGVTVINIIDECYSDLEENIPVIKDNESPKLEDNNSNNNGNKGNFNNNGNKGNSNNNGNKGNSNNNGNKGNSNNNGNKGNSNNNGNNNNK